MNFNTDFQLSQRYMVELFQDVSRLVSMNMTIDRGQIGFNEIVSNRPEVLQKEIRAVIGTKIFKK